MDTELPKYCPHAAALGDSLKKIGAEGFGAGWAGLPSGTVVLKEVEELREILTQDGETVNTLNFFSRGFTHPRFTVERGESCFFCIVPPSRGYTAVSLAFPITGSELRFSVEKFHAELLFNNGEASEQSSIVLVRHPGLLPVLQAHVDRLLEVKSLMTAGKLPFKLDPGIKQALEELPEKTLAPRSAGKADVQQISTTLTPGERRNIKKTAKLLAGVEKVFGEGNPLSAQVEEAKKLLGQLAAAPKQKRLPGAVCSPEAKSKKQRCV